MVTIETIEELETKIIKALELISDLRMENSRLESDTQRIKSEHDQMKISYDQLKHSIAEKEALIAEKDALIVKLKAELEQANKELNSIKEKDNALDNKISSMMGRLDSLGTFSKLSSSLSAAISVPKIEKTPEPPIASEDPIIPREEIKVKGPEPVVISQEPPTEEIKVEVKEEPTSPVVEEASSFPEPSELISSEMNDDDEIVLLDDDEDELLESVLPEPNLKEEVDQPKEEPTLESKIASTSSTSIPVVSESAALDTLDDLDADIIIDEGDDDSIDVFDSDDDDFLIIEEDK